MWSQYGHDTYIAHKYLENRSVGFFVELGALDGLRHSNTKWFEERGWLGVCIEPHPLLYKRLVANRTCICIQAVICENIERDALFLAIDPTGPVGLSGLIDSYDARHRDRISRECKAAGVSASPIRVQCRTMESILTECEKDVVDFLSLDVEGAELSVLKSVDWDRRHFVVMLIENNYGTSEVEQFLRTKGYRKAETLGCDEVYVPIS